MTLEDTKKILKQDKKVTAGSVGKLKYLYGVNYATWLDMNYIKAFELKNELANKVITKCLQVHFLKRDYSRINACQKAISFNNERLAE